MKLRRERCWNRGERDGLGLGERNRRRGRREGDILAGWRSEGRRREREGERGSSCSVARSVAIATFLVDEKIFTNQFQSEGHNLVISNVKGGGYTKRRDINYPRSLRNENEREASELTTFEREEPRQREKRHTHRSRSTSRETPFAYPNESLQFSPCRESTPRATEVGV